MICYEILGYSFFPLQNTRVRGNFSSVREHPRVEVQCFPADDVSQADLGLSPRAQTSQTLTGISAFSSVLSIRTAIPSFRRRRSYPPLLNPFRSAPHPSFFPPRQPSLPPPAPAPSRHDRRRLRRPHHTCASRTTSPPCGILRR